MQVVTGAWLCLAGILAAVAGLADAHRARRLSRGGATAWAVAVPSCGDKPSRADDRGRRMLVQFALPDGRIVEQSCPRPWKASALRPGQKVLVWYDPADPSDVLVYGHRSRYADGLFLAAGLVLFLTGAGLVIV
jgi:Protein of unknown function (DUF3592)/Mu transposase, C-terminal